MLKKGVRFFARPFARLNVHPLVGRKSIHFVFGCLSSMEFADNKGLGLEMLMNKRKTSVDGMSQASRSPPASIASGYSPSIRSVRMNRIGDKRPSPFFSSNKGRESVSIGTGGSVEEDEEDEEDEDEELNESCEDGGTRSRFQSGFDKFRSSSARSDASFSAISSQQRGGFPVAPPMIPRRTQDDVLNAKRELLYQFERLEKRGVKVPRKFTLASDFDEMQLEYDRLRRDREMDLSVAFQKKVILAAATGLEFMNTRFDPFGIQLDGWSEQLQGEITDYDEVLEQLATKYAGRAQIAPELKLMLMLSGSAFTYHLSKTYFRNLPGLEQILKQNPDLMRQFASAAMSTHAQNAAQQGDAGTSHAANIFSTLFGGGGGGGPSRSQPHQQPPPPQSFFSGVGVPPPAPPQQRMRGPTNVDDLLSELRMNADATQPPPKREPIVVLPHSEVEVRSVGSVDNGNGDDNETYDQDNEDDDDNDSIEHLLQTAAGRGGGFTIDI